MPQSRSPRLPRKTVTSMNQNENNENGNNPGHYVDRVDEWQPDEIEVMVNMPEIELWHPYNPVPAMFGRVSDPPNRECSECREPVSDEVFIHLHRETQQRVGPGFYCRECLLNSGMIQN